jgi:hypothetical protein
MSALHVQIGAHGIVELLWQNLLFQFNEFDVVTEVLLNMLGLLRPDTCSFSHFRELYCLYLQGQAAHNE